MSRVSSSRGALVGLAVIEAGAVLQLLKKIASGRRAGLWRAPDNGVAQRPRDEVRDHVYPSPPNDKLQEGFIVGRFKRRGHQDHGKGIVRAVVAVVEKDRMPRRG